jgi:hypothetical protein
MNVQEPYKLSDIDLNNIVFKKIKLIKSKKIIFLKYKNPKLTNFVIQLSKINNNNVNNSNEIEFIIDNESYINFFENIDNYIIDQAQLNQSWFDHLENQSSLSYQRILQDNNSIKLRLYNNEELTTQLLINDESATNFDDVISNESSSKVILEIYAIWIKNSSFGLLLRPINISMKFKEKPVYNYKFLDDSENNSELSEMSELDFQTEQNKTSKKTSSSSETTIDKSENNNELFIKTDGLFNNNSSASSSDSFENDLNKLILG